ncbi:pilus assembly protein PilM [Desulfosporosinus sp. SYSU MS00001]|uniref:pilus assembly protein PilM n=1 Tax=Desulfosporosinus sp. SYSU MS00001 TaxID=3416284 RepID=UPI003CF8007A
MYKQKQWLAVIRENNCVVAKVAFHKLKLDILELFEYHSEIESGSSKEQNEGVVREVPGEERSTVGKPLEEKFWQEERLQNRRTGLLKNWLDNNHVPISKLRLAVSCPGVITRMVTLPLLSSHDMNRLLTEQVEQYFTLNIADYVVDYRLLERFSEEGELRQRVLLAAIPRYQWEKLWTEWEEIGLRPKVVDLAADGLARLYSKLTSKEVHKAKVEEETSLDLAIVDLNPERAEFVLLEHGMFFLYSDIEVASDNLKNLRTALSRASEGLGTGESEATNFDLQTVKQHACTKGEIELTLGNVLQSLAEFFSFFAARHFGKSIDRIYITGEYSDIPFLEEIFQSNLEIPTQAGFPNGWQPRFSRKAKTFQKSSMKYGSLYGLAMREG